MNSGHWRDEDCLIMIGTLVVDLSAVRASVSTKITSGGCVNAGTGQRKCERLKLVCPTNVWLEPQAIPGAKSIDAYDAS
jgi:hypothetical protein